MKTLRLTQIGTLAAAFALVALFQNCGRVAFDSSLQDDQVEALGPGEGQPGQQLYVENFSPSANRIIDKADVLFVLDESVSMSSIVSAVTAGFASINQSAFPADTMMAVTNMAPAYFTAARAFDPTRSYIAPFSVKGAVTPKVASPVDTAKQPGFLKLVQASTISAYRSLYPGLQAQFALPGCASAWFKRDDVNSQGDRCLTAHAQASFLPIGFEAGVISLYQLATMIKGRGERLFRAGAVANVIFISDTHEPGNPGYYGSPGGLSSPLPFSELRSALEESSPGIEGLRLHGIVPLPTAGDPLLEGVRTIGRLPVTPEESKLPAENTNGFAYLPYIKSGNGTAMHPIGNDWGAALTEMVEEIKVQTTPTFSLSQPASAIEKVTVNGVEISPSQYYLRSDGKGMELQPNAAWGATISVEVRYRGV